MLAADAGARYDISCPGKVRSHRREHQSSMKGHIFQQICSMQPPEVNGGDAPLSTDDQRRIGALPGLKARSARVFLRKVQLTRVQTILQKCGMRHSRFVGEPLCILAVTPVRLVLR